MNSALSVVSFNSLGKKLFFSVTFLIIFAFLTFFSIQKSFADEYVTSDSYTAPAVSDSTKASEYSENTLGTNPEVEPTFRNFIQILMIESLSAVSCQLAGYDPTRPNEKCLGVDPATGKIGFAENGGGLVVVLGKMIDYTFVPPASSSQYVAYLQNNFGIVKGTYAAPLNQDDYNACRDNSKGVGFCSILPILDLWVAMRNIVYLILILIFIVIGVGIMLRIHIDPRTVMTVQNQLPKIIAGIIVISFSFAIAGFLIDIMWVTTYLFASVLGGATGMSNDTMLSIIRAANPIDAANAIVGEGDGGIINIASSASAALANIVDMAFRNQETNMGALKDPIHYIVNILAFLVFIIAIIVALLRLWVSLVITYVNIILDIVFAPFWILAGALPGSSLGMSGWFRDMLGNLAVFPMAIAFFILANYFVNAFSESANNELQNQMAPPLLGGTDSSAVAAIIGLGFILMLPSLLATTKSFFKAPKINFGPVMKPVAVGGAVVGGMPKRLGSGVLGEMTRLRYDAHGRPHEPGKVGTMIRMFRGGH